MDDVNKRKQKKTYATWDSQAVAHPSTKRAQQCLTSSDRTKTFFFNFFIKTVIESINIQYSNTDILNKPKTRSYKILIKDIKAHRSHTKFLISSFIWWFQISTVYSSKMSKSTTTFIDVSMKLVQKYFIENYFQVLNSLKYENYS